MVNNHLEIVKFLIENDINVTVHDNFLISNNNAIIWTATMSYQFIIIKKKIEI